MSDSRGNMYWRREAELADALADAKVAADGFVKALEKGAGLLGKGGGGAGGPGGLGPGGGGAASSKVPTAKAPMTKGSGGGFADGVGLSGLRSRVATAGGARGFAGAMAGRAALGGAVAGVAAVGAIGANLASAGLGSVARGGDFSAGASLQGDRLISALPFGLGEQARGRVQVTEGVISDLNSITGDLAALGVDTTTIREEAGPILRAQQKRRLADQRANANYGEAQGESETFIGELGRSLHEFFGSAGLNGAK